MLFMEPGERNADHGLLPGVDTLHRCLSPAPGIVELVNAQEERFALCVRHEFQNVAHLQAVLDGKQKGILGDIDNHACIFPGRERVRVLEIMRVMVSFPS